MTQYTIAAIPTVYRGRKYRSRLEARWAAFFDRLGIEHEYEPFDLGKWSPDFLLPEWNVLVEVKPITEFDHVTFHKMWTACAERSLLEGDDAAVRAILVLGVAPRFLDRCYCQVGWWAQRADAAEIALLCWMADPDEPRLNVDIAAVHDEGWFTIGGDAGPNSTDYECPRWYPEHGMKLWAQATDEVQWHAGGQA